MKTNIAENIKAHYESKDFKSDYFCLLAESFGNDEHEIINRIIDKFNVSNYETQKYLSNWFVIDREQAKKIYDFISDNLEDFTTDFNSWYVGYTSLDSISFGEQEEQLEGLYNHITKKDYSIKYLRKIFDESGYYVNDRNYAYYDLSSHGLHIDLLKDADSLNTFLLTLNCEVEAES